MIEVSHLRKVYRTPQKEEGAAGLLRNIFARQYKQINAVNDISFTIDQGEIVGFVGPNGAGKTTTMKMLAGILYPTSGIINVLGHTPFHKEHAYLRQISFIMGQKNQMLWELPAVDTFKLNKAIYDIPDDAYTKTLHELIEMLDADSVINQPVKTLSLGQRMKVELISTLIHKPKVLFLDEPTIGLDVVAQKNIRDFIQQYQKTYNATILLTTHYMEDVRRLAKRVIIIDRGSIIYDGDIEKLIKKYARTKTVEIIVEDMPNSSILEKILEKTAAVESIDFPRVRFRVSRKDVTQLIAAISKHIGFIDITIEEEKIEDIIRTIFEKSSVKV